MGKFNISYLLFLSFFLLSFETPKLDFYNTEIINIDYNFVKGKILSKKMDNSINFSKGYTVGAGSLMATYYMEMQNLFTIHTNNCSGGEYFFDVTGTGLGFCIEITTRAATTYWRDALLDCLDEGKRLPEIWEMQVVCDVNSSIILKGQQWAGNFPMIVTPGGTGWGFAVPAYGSGNCSWGQWFYSAKNNADETKAYRCVR